jgi:hypothetical protein
MTTPAQIHLMLVSEQAAPNLLCIDVDTGPDARQAQGDRFF